MAINSIIHLCLYLNACNVHISLLYIWAQNFFEGLNQKSAMISMCKIHIYIDSERFRKFIEKYRWSRLLVNDTWAKWGFEIWLLW